MTDFAAIRDKYACPCDESVMYDKFLLPVRAEGMHVWVDGDTTPYLDTVLSYSSINFGHCHPFLVKAAQEAVASLTQIHSFHTKGKLLVSQYLANKVSPNESFKVYYDVGGSSVVASAVRLCRNFSKKPYMITFTGAFHGTGHYAASLTDDRLLNKAQYGIANINDFVIRLPYPSPLNGVTTNETIALLEKELDSGRVAGVMVEPVQGANGFLFPWDDFLPRLREVTTRHDVLLAVDEIQTGMGRCGRFFAYQKSDILPDIVLLSKSLAGGFFPLSAIIARSALFDAVPARGTAFQSTFNNNPFGLVMAQKVIELMETENCLENARAKGAILLDRLRFVEENPCITRLRGEGLALAFDLTAPDAPDEPSEERAKALVRAGLEEHIIFYSCGVHRNSIKMAPALTIRDSEIDLIAESLKRALHRAELQ